jgi:hypothetical protein
VGAFDPRGGRLLDDRREASMTDLELLLAIAGVIVTVLVVAGMILITSHGEVSLYPEESDSQGSNLSRAGAPDPAQARP